MTMAQSCLGEHVAWEGMTRPQSEVGPLPADAGCGAAGIPSADGAHVYGDERGFMPTFDVKENKDDYVFKADLPGVRRATSTSR